MTQSDRGKVVEIGWLEVWRSHDTTSQSASKKNWYLFAAKYVDWNRTQWSTQLAPNLQPRNEDLWRISGVPKPNGTTDWHLDVNFLLGQGWVDWEKFNTNWNSGVPMGEVERRGDETGMSAQHRHLQWKLGSGELAGLAEQHMLAHRDEAAGERNYNKVADNAFETVPGARWLVRMRREHEHASS